MYQHECRQMSRVVEVAIVFLRNHQSTACLQVPWLQGVCGRLVAESGNVHEHHSRRMLDSCGDREQIIRWVVKNCYFPQTDDGSHCGRVISQDSFSCRWKDKQVAWKQTPQMRDETGNLSHQKTQPAEQEPHGQVCWVHCKPKWVPIKKQAVDTTLVTFNGQHDKMENHFGKAFQWGIDQISWLVVWACLWKILYLIELTVVGEPTLKVGSTISWGELWTLVKRRESAVHWQGCICCFLILIMVGMWPDPLNFYPVTSPLWWSRMWNCVENCHFSVLLLLECLITATGAENMTEVFVCWLTLKL